MTASPHDASPSIASAEAERLIAAAQRLRDEVGKRIVGQHAVLEEIMMALVAGGHALLVGVPGLACALGGDSGTIREGSVRVRRSGLLTCAVFGEGVAIGRQVDVQHRQRDPACACDSEGEAKARSCV